ncbi:MAG: ABC transporter ATP-binding protein [Deltaproteobacteria bacterium]|nr:MAG: ABC transporter ATP-binding protein [Deltaproteobacteria bacterium]HDH87323.1 ABC transporter ATP-binding protein [Desulfobacteraceae bacterium]
MGAILLRLAGVDVFHGKIQALWDVSINVEEGSIVTIVGANSAGKTTLLRAISGLIQPKNGKIEFLAKRINHVSPDKIVKLGISQVTETRDLFPYMTVIDNLEMGSVNIEHAWKSRKETLRWVYALFPVLRERKKQLAETLSGGEQQMLAIGRALMGRPKLLMLDELSLGLAPAIVLELFKTITEINKNGMTILLVEQNTRHSLELAQKGYVLENGRVVLSGKGRELLNNEHVKKAYLGM